MIHPFCAANQALGYKHIDRTTLSSKLCDIRAMTRFPCSPTRVAVWNMRVCWRLRPIPCHGQGIGNICLIRMSAHATNPQRK